MWCSLYTGCISTKRKQSDMKGSPRFKRFVFSFSLLLCFFFYNLVHSQVLLFFSLLRFVAFPSFLLSLHLLLHLLIVFFPHFLHSLIIFHWVFCFFFAPFWGWSVLRLWAADLSQTTLQAALILAWLPLCGFKVSLQHWSRSSRTRCKTK